MDLLDDIVPLGMPSFFDPTAAFPLLFTPSSVVTEAYPASYDSQASDETPTSSEPEASPLAQSPHKRGVRAKKRRDDDDDADFCVDDDASSSAPVVAPIVRDVRARKKGRALQMSSDDDANAEDAEEGVGEPKSVTLSRERLLTISSAEFERFLARVKRPLSTHETNEVRRQRRLIKNRESAALSRDRKRQAMEVLEEKNAALQKENDQLREELAQTKARLARYERARLAPGVLLAVIFSVGLLWGSGSLYGHPAPVPGSPVASSSAYVAPSDMANLRRLLSVEATLAPQRPAHLAIANETWPVAAER